MISFIELWSQPWLPFSTSKSISQIINPNHSSKNSLFLTDEFDDSPPEDEDGNRTKSIFVKVPLKANNEMESLMYRAVNMREKIMLTQVLPKLQTFLDEKCEGVARIL